MDEHDAIELEARAIYAEMALDAVRSVVASHDAGAVDTALSDAVARALDCLGGADG